MLGSRQIAQGIGMRFTLDGVGHALSLAHAGGGCRPSARRGAVLLNESGNCCGIAHE